MGRFRGFRMLLAVCLMGVMLVSSAGVSNAAPCIYQAQIDAQNDAIAALIAERDAQVAQTPVYLQARVAAGYDAQIAARQGLVATWQAECAS